MKYDPANWLKHSKESVYHTAKQGTLITLTKEYLSPLLLVRWTRNNYKEPVFGFLEAEIISPLGTPTRSRQEFEISTNQQHYQFWTVQNDGLPYKLHARLIQNPKLSTQLEIWEYLPLIDSGSGSQNPNNPFQVSNSPGVTIVSFSPPATPPLVSDKGLVSSIPAATGSFGLRPATPARQSGFGFNNSNKTVWILFDTAPAAPAKPASPVPPSGNFDIPQGYVGVIQAAIAAGGAPVTGTIDITEFNAV